MPWIPELFSPHVVQQLIDKRRAAAEPAAVPFFDGLLSGQTEALVGSFAGEPELHHPIRGRVKGAASFRHFADQTATWLRDHQAEVEDVDLVVTGPRTVEEVELHLKLDGRAADLPVAIVADRDSDARLLEVRVYFSTWPLTGGHAIRPPLLQADPDLEEGDVVGSYQQALARGDAEGAAAAFEPDGYVREPAGGRFRHEGAAAIRALFDSFFSNGGGIPLEHCTVTDDGRACALEYNVVRWGQTDLPPEAGVAVYVRGTTGKLAAGRIYDDSDPPLPAA